MSNRPEVVEALLRAHEAGAPWAEVAALEFQFEPPATDQEKDEARAQAVAVGKEKLERMARGETDESR